MLLKVDCLPNVIINFIIGSVHIITDNLVYRAFTYCTFLFCLLSSSVLPVIHPTLNSILIFHAVLYLISDAIKFLFIRYPYIFHISYHGSIDGIVCI